MTPSTPEGPAATRCEVCGREKSPNLGGGVRTRENFCFREKRPRDTECWRRGYERLAARLVEVERERDEWKARTYSARTDAMLTAAGICDQDGAHRTAETLRNGAASPLALSGLPPLTSETAGPTANARALADVVIDFLSSHGGSECAGRGECVCDDAWPAVGLAWGDIEGARRRNSKRYAERFPTPAALVPKEEDK